MNTRLRPNTITFACSAYGPEPGAVIRILAEMQQWIAAPVCEQSEPGHSGVPELGRREIAPQVRPIRTRQRGRDRLWEIRSGRESRTAGQKRYQAQRQQNHPAGA